MAELVIPCSSRVIRRSEIGRSERCSQPVKLALKEDAAAIGSINLSVDALSLQSISGLQVRDESGRTWNMLGTNDMSAPRAHKHDIVALISSGMISSYAYADPGMMISV